MQRVWPVLFATLAVLAGLPVGAHEACAFPWSIDMFRGDAVQPLAVAPRVMPEGTLPQNGELPISRNDAAEVLHNPLKPTMAHVKVGEQLFATNCAVCHGAAGKGDGPVAYRFKDRYPVTNLLTDTVFQDDGYVYATIRDGGLMMPSLADSMSPEERWEVVLFIRYLEGKLSPLDNK